MKLEKEEFLKIYSDDITKKEYDRIIGLIGDRFYEIMKTLAPRLQWVDYANEYKDHQGWFDPSDYKEFIAFTGELSSPEPFDYEFPTRWLYEDFEKEFKEEVERVKNEENFWKQKKKLKREELQIKKENMKEIIKSKLSKEELKFIKFK